MEYLVPGPRRWRWSERPRAPHLTGLIIRLIIQTIRRDPTGSVWTDEAPNLSRPDPTGADQTDAEHQATDLAVRRGCWPVPHIGSRSGRTWLPGGGRSCCRLPSVA